MQFLYPNFLWGLVLVGIPILIHLLQLRRPQRILFTNIRFVREVELTTIRRRRLQELLVLLLRVSSILFLVFVFAQPFVPAHRRSEQGGEVDVLLDASPSMQAAGESPNSLLSGAVRQAQLLGKSYGPTTHFRLLGKQGGILAQPAYLNRIAGITQADAHYGWDGVANQPQLTGKSRGPAYIFSDFQRSNRSTEALQKLADSREIVLVPQVAKPVANVYVDSVWLDDAFVRIHTNLALHIRLRNGGAKAITDCQVKVKLGKQQVAAFRVAVGVGQLTIATVQVQLSANKLELGEVLTGDSPITFDNSYFFTLQPTPTIRVLEIASTPLAKQAYDAETLFTYAFAKPQNVNYDEMRKANLVLVREVTDISVSLREALVEVVRRGGSVAVVPPGREAEQAPTLQLLRALGINGVQGENAPSVLQEVAMPNAHDPFFKEVFGVQARQVTMPQVTPVIRLTRPGTDILRLRDGDSYLAEYSGLGMGRTYVFTAPFAKAYGDFTEQGLFIPVLYRLAMRSYHVNQRLAYRLTEPALTLEMPPIIEASKQQETAFQLVRDSLAFIPAQRLRGTSLQLELPAELSQPGFYKLQRRGQLLTTLAFNTDRSESNLATYSAAELRQLIGPNHPTIQVLDGGTDPEALAHYRAGQTGQALWRYCLLAVLACLLLEGLVLRFGRPNAAARPVVAA